MTPFLIPFRAEHILALSFRDGDRIEATRAAVRHETDGPAFTAIHNGMLMGCAGIGIPYPGFGTAWAVLSKELVTLFPIWTTRVIRRQLQDTVKSFQLHRVEMVALPDNVSWAHCLGFRQEGFARSYTADKRDVIRLEMIIG